MNDIEAIEILREEMMKNCIESIYYQANELAIQALQEKVDRENPKPLTWDELTERVGKPVYIVIGINNHWVVIEEAESDHFKTDTNIFYWRYHLGIDYIAYDHEPKEDIANEIN